MVGFLGKLKKFFTGKSEEDKNKLEEEKIEEIQENIENEEKIQNVINEKIEVQNIEEENFERENIEENIIEEEEKEIREESLFVATEQICNYQKGMETYYKEGIDFANNIETENISQKSETLNLIDNKKYDEELNDDKTPTDEIKNFFVGSNEILEIISSNEKEILEEKNKETFEEISEVEEFEKENYFLQDTKKENEFEEVIVENEEINEVEDIQEEVEEVEEVSEVVEEEAEIEDLGDDVIIEYYHTKEKLIEPAAEKKKKSFFERLKEGLKKTRDNILGKIKNILNLYTKIDDELLEQLEEILIQSDIGVKTSMKIIDIIKDRVAEESIKDPQEIMKVLEEELNNILEKTYQNKSPNIIKSDHKPYVIMIAGVNGVGKTTSIGKIANNFVNQNKKVILAACDTFRAAAVDQLEIWAKRAGVGIVRRKEEGVDPASVAYDAFNAAKARNIDIVLVDTAGRLHTKVNLMEELKKIKRVLQKIDNEAPHEVLLVLDATTGQNALQQARIFNEAIKIDGIVLTKLDGTAKGGIVIAIAEELGIPVKLVGIGEGIDDLKEFNSKDFVRALFS